MNRRQIAVALATLLVMPGGKGWTQQSSKPRIVWFSGASKAGASSSFDALLEGLRTLGYQQDRDFALDAYWADFSAERLRKVAAEIESSRPTVIVANGAAIGVAARIKPPIPVVFVMSGNPVDAGLAESFSHPGGNATGISLMALALTEKRMDLLKQIVPGMHRVAFLANPEHSGEHQERAAAQAAADKLRLEHTYYQARTPEEVRVALAAIGQAKPDALVVFGDSLALQERSSIASVMRKARIPCVSGWAEFAESGFLLAYGPERRASWTRLPYFVDRILKGAKPRDLAIELPTVSELVDNNTTARELKLTLPSSVMIQATRAVD